ncbi:SGNH/GDSL hydrolase family protein [Rhizobium sp. RM]|uniref:SGNH/GDSL hydrolase family protein n=1 Tax=Rhizobium sp. RM TaxID=2748079 RepID=UPI00110E53FB|nr:SGNH/GDSL hydrolase family protein [Rhizobium sp. RM]NWJ24783.1 SGNH/GDSL hydrolase family protein [Rhizobium sp. RM]TMV16582.1 SGNH/GDSL hydrolase family protein [Rhizobium sp. Td3]
MSGFSFNSVPDSGFPPGVKAFPLSRALRVGVITDSQGSRGCGTGPYSMDGARALSYPTRLAAWLRKMGFQASSESLSEYNNNEAGAAALPLYDPRYSAGTFSVAAGTGLGGLLITKTAAAASGVGRFAPSTPINTFEVWTPVNTYGTLNCRIDTEAVVPVAQNGTPAFKKTLITSTAGVGQHALTIEKQGGAGATAVFLNTIIAYNSLINDIRIINLGARGWSTTDWLVADQPWRAFPGLAAMQFDIVIVMLGTNDRRVGGSGNSLATYLANLQSIITQCAAAKVILAMPMPINPANVSTFTDAQMLAGLKTLASDNKAALFRSDLFLGPWVAEKTADALHWKAPASDLVGAGLATIVAQAAIDLAA